MPEDQAGKCRDRPSQKPAPPPSPRHEVPLTTAEKRVVKEGDEEYREHLRQQGGEKDAPG